MHIPRWHLSVAALISTASLLVPGIARATDWGFANASMCDSGAWPSSYLGDCGSYSNGYSRYGPFLALTDNRNFETGGPSQIGQHSANERFFLAWDAAGTMTWNGPTPLGCVQASNFNPGARDEDIASLINAALRAQQNGENVVISLVSDQHSIDGLSYNASGQSTSYPADAPAAGRPHPPNALDFACGAWEALHVLQAWGVNVVHHAAVEAFNEPDANGLSPSAAAGAFCAVQAYVAGFGDWTLAGTFMSGGKYNDTWYINQYMRDEKAECGPAAHWSFHDYHDIGFLDNSFSDAIYFLTTLVGNGEPAKDVWVTESGPNGYWGSPYPVCNFGDQYYEAHVWLNLLRSGLVEHLFWYDAPYLSTPFFPGIFLPPGGSCGNSTLTQVPGTTVAYQVLDTSY